MISNGLAYINVVVLATSPTGVDAKIPQQIYPHWSKTLLRAVLITARRRF